jgi:tRNA-Thr(GGU) m(6)t(6)A37 methyltransferase TsaA
MRPKTTMKARPVRLMLRPIGVIHSPFVEPAGTPLQPNLAQDVEGTVEVFPEFAAALQDLEGFERIWLLYWFDRSAPFRPRVTPFLDSEAHGLFATRAPCRPNPIGLSAVRLLRCEGRRLHIAGVDILDQTPLLDIKPYVPAFDHFEVRRAGWLDGKPPRRVVADDRFRARNLAQVAAVKKAARKQSHSSKSRKPN